MPCLHPIWFISRPHSKKWCGLFESPRRCCCCRRPWHCCCWKLHHLALFVATCGLDVDSSALLLAWVFTPEEIPRQTVVNWLQIPLYLPRGNRISLSVCFGQKTCLWDFLSSCWNTPIPSSGVDNISSASNTAVGPFERRTLKLGQKQNIWHVMSSETWALKRLSKMFWTQKYGELIFFGTRLKFTYSLLNCPLWVSFSNLVITMNALAVQSNEIPGILFNRSKKLAMHFSLWSRRIHKRKVAQCDKPLQKDHRCQGIWYTMGECIPGFALQMCVGQWRT